MNITVNGEPHVLPEGSHLQDLIDQLQLSSQRLAVELNLEIVPRSEYHNQALRDGDRIEIVHAIGGG